MMNNKCQVCGKIEDVGLEYVNPEIRLVLCSEHFNMVCNNEWDKLNKFLDNKQEFDRDKFRVKHDIVEQLLGEEIERQN